MPTLTELITGKTAAEIAAGLPQGPPVTGKPVSEMSDEELAAIVKGGQGQPQAAPPPPSVSQRMTDAELAAIVKAGQPPPPPVNVAEDVAKSTGTGLTRGLANIVGLPGDIKSGIDWTVNKGTDFIFGAPTPEQAAIRERVQTLGLPTSQAIRDVASKATGVELYDPQTTPGKFAETAGEFTSSALAGPARKGVDLLKQVFKYGTVPGLVSEGAGQAAQKYAPGNQVVETVARVAGGALPAIRSAAASSRTSMRPPASGVDPNQRIRMAKEFEVPLTEGQATGNITQQGFEEAARHGAKGPRATETMQQFEARQRAALDAAGGQMRERFQGGFAPVQAADQAGDQLAAAVKQRAIDLRKGSQAKYAEAEQLNPSIKAGAVQSVPQEVAAKLVATDFPFDTGLHPTAFRAMAEIERLGGLPGAPAGASVLAMDVRGIEQVRKRIGQMKGTTPEDMMATGKVKRAFDDWLDDAVDRQLFSGDPAGLDALKEARSLWKDYRGLTTPKRGDDASRVISSMATKDVTGQEVANWLYGSSVVGAQPTTVRVAQQLKTLFKPQSEEWSAIRQGAWTRVIQGATAAEKGPQAISTAVNEFLNGRGKALAQVLYSPEERDMMSRFGQTAKYLVPNPRATNPSRSGFTGARLAHASLRGIGAMLGMAQHADPLTGGVGGYVIGEAIDKGQSAWQNARNAAAAQRAVNPKLNAPIFDPKSLAALVGRAAITGEQQDRAGR